MKKKTIEPQLIWFISFYCFGGLQEDGKNFNNKTVSATWTQTTLEMVLLSDQFTELTFFIFIL